MAYTDKTNIQNYLNITIDATLDEQIATWISAVEAWVNTYTGKTFESESVSYKLYDGNGTDELLIDDLTALTKIEILDSDGEIDETIDNSNEYWLYPENETAKNRIIINIENAPIGIFTNGNQNIKVYGTFGYSASVPEDIKLATTMLVAGIVEKGLKGGNLESEKLGDYSVSFGLFLTLNGNRNFHFFAKSL